MLVNENELKVLQSNLLRTIQWTDSLSDGFDIKNGNFGEVFRKTNPILRGKRVFNIEGNYTSWNIDEFTDDIYEDYRFILKEALVCRKDKGSVKKLKGRILIFDTQQSTMDGAPIIESLGFVDECDVPPIDTWFFLQKGFYGRTDKFADLALFCWVPELFIPIMQHTIDVEILGSYLWLDEENPLLNTKILNLDI